MALLNDEVAQKVNSRISNIKIEFAKEPTQLDKFKTESWIDNIDNKELPDEQKKKFNREIETLENKYKKGVITEQHEAYVKYDIQLCTKNGFYAFYTAPAYQTKIFPYRRRKMELRGFTEESFERKLRESLTSPHYRVFGDISIQTSEGYHPFEPDVAIIEINDTYGVRIDIEIDEPYSGYDKTPIHYVGCGDEFRDHYLANRGWLVVRFSEKQIVQEPENCIYYLQSLISQIDSDFKISCHGNSPKHDKCWTEGEARIMVAQRYRENLLKHEFGRREKDDNIITTGLTKLEKDAADNAKPIVIPTDPPQNIDKTAIKFPQDTLISFEPKEHIYLYNGQIQLMAVSNVINQFFLPFNPIKQSKIVAQRNGLSQCEVLEKWDSEGQEAREVGTFLHAQIESYFFNKPYSTSTHFCYNGNFVKENKNVSINKEMSYFKNFLSSKSISPFRTEWHIFDMELKIAGTIDLLCKNGKNFEIFDWKRSRKASPNETIFQYGINGLDNIPDISFMHYALQQNLYKYILEKNYDIKVENMYIVVLHPMFDNYQMYKIPDKSKEIDIIKSYISKSVN